MESQLPKYTKILLHEMERVHLAIRGRNGHADQSGIAAARLEEIARGARPSHQEHKKICKGLPRMRHYQNLLLEWEKTERAAPPARAVQVSAAPAPAPVSPPTFAAIPTGLVEAATKLVDGMIVSTAPAPPQPKLPLPAPPLPPEPKMWAGKDSVEARAPMLVCGERLGPRLKRIRKAAGYTWEKLSEAIGTVPSTIGLWESDAFHPSQEMLVKLMIELPELAPLDEADDLTSAPVSATGDDEDVEIEITDEPLRFKGHFEDAEEPEPTFGARLRAARRAAGKLVPILSKEIGVSRTKFYEWEVDDGVPNGETLHRLQKILPTLVLNDAETLVVENFLLLHQPPKPLPTRALSDAEKRRKIEWKYPAPIPLPPPPPPAPATRTIETFRVLVASTKHLLKARRLDETVRDFLRAAQETGLTLAELNELFRTTKAS